MTLPVNPIGLTLARVNRLLRFEDGVLYWRVSRGTAKAGAVAGGKSHHGYTEVQIDGAKRKAHRVIWFLTYGVWPELFIDHINGDRADNRIENLREANFDLNAQNVRRARKDCVSGLMGVRLDRRLMMYQARITSGGRQKHIGYFADRESAHAAYVAVKRSMHQGCTL